MHHIDMITTLVVSFSHFLLKNSVAILNSVRIAWFTALSEEGHLVRCRMHITHIVYIIILHLSE